MSGGDVTLLTSIVEERVQEVGYSVVRFNTSGEPHAAAIVDAVADRWDRSTPDPEKWDGKPITLLVTGGTMFGAGVVTARPVKLFATPGRGTGWAYLPKGKRSNGFQYQADKVLDWRQGYDGIEGIGGLRAAVDAAVDELPKLEPLTQAHLDALPRPDEDSDGSSPDCTLAIFGTWRSPGGRDENAPGAVWLCSEYSPDDDIVDGVLCVNPAHGCSEHGSAYGRDLLRFGGAVVGFAPVTFREAVIEWTRLDADGIVRAVTDRQRVPA